MRASFWCVPTIVHCGKADHASGCRKTRRSVPSSGINGMYSRMEQRLLTSLISCVFRRVRLPLLRIDLIVRTRFRLLVDDNFRLPPPLSSVLHPVKSLGRELQDSQECIYPSDAFPSLSYMLRSAVGPGSPKPETGVRSSQHLSKWRHGPVATAMDCFIPCLL